MRFISRQNFQVLILVAILALQGYSFAHKPEQVASKNISVYTSGQDGLSAYQVWLAAGNKGTLVDYFDAMRGNDGQTTVQTVAKILPSPITKDGHDGINGINAEPCHVNQAANGDATLTCPDGSSAFFPKPKDGLDAQDLGSIQIQTNAATCMLQYKYTNQRFFTNIPIPGCTPNVQ